MVCGARVRRSIPRSRRASSRLRRPQASQEGASRASTRGWRFPALTSMSRSESIKADKRRFNVIAGCTDATTPTNVARRLHKIDPCPSPCRRHARPCPPPCPPDCVRHASACPQRHGGGIREVDLKSRAGRHAVGIPTPLLAALREHKTFQDAERKAAGQLWHPGDWVFTRPNGKPIDPRADHDAWKRLLKEAGVRDARLHDARHTRRRPCCWSSAYRHVQGQ